MDPNNGLCNWIGASGACDYQRMYNFNNYPTANNGFYTGNNSIFAGNTTNTNVSYTTDANGAVNYSYNSGPPHMPLWAGLLIGIGMIGQGVGAYAQSQAAIQQQKDLQQKAEEENKEYKAEAAEQRAQAKADAAMQRKIQMLTFLVTLKKLDKEERDT